MLAELDHVKKTIWGLQTGLHDRNSGRLCYRADRSQRGRKEHYF